MKWIITTICIVLWCKESLNAQKLRESDVPKTVQSQFKKDFSGAKYLIWKQDINYYEAGFKTNGIYMRALYDINGHFIRSETDLKAAALPLAIKKTLKTDYQGYGIKSAKKVTTENQDYYQLLLKKGAEKIQLILDQKGQLSKTSAQ